MNAMSRWLRTRPTQVAFSILLLVCIALLVWWLLDQSRVTRSFAREQIAAFDRDANSAQALRGRGMPLSQVRALYPNLVMHETAQGLTIDRGYRERFEAERQRHMVQYGWEGLFFLLVLGAGLWVIGMVLRQRRDLAQRQQNFLAAVTHELKNPLASLKLSAETLSLRAPDPEHREALSARMLSDIGRLETMVGNLLGAARAEDGTPQAAQAPGRPEAVPLADVATELVADDAFLARAQGVAVTVQGDQATAAHAKPAHVRLVLSNLIDNAVKSVAAAEKADVRIRIDRVGSCARLDVEDDGLGFSANEQAHLFKKFFRTGNELQRRTRGTGLGLYLVKQLVEGDGGTVSAQSDGPGRGARFTVKWPLVQAP